MPARKRPRRVMMRMMMMRQQSRSHKDQLWKLQDLKDIGEYPNQEDAGPSDSLPTVVPCAKDGNCLYEALGYIRGLHPQSVRSEISHFITHATKAQLETIAGSHGFSMKVVREEATKIKEKRR